MAYLRTDDHVRIYYEEHGPIEPKATGSPLVLAYGIGGNADLWDVNVPALAPRHRLAVIGARGPARPGNPGGPPRPPLPPRAAPLPSPPDPPPPHAPPPGAAPR